MVDGLTTKELDEIYKRLEKVVDTRKTQKKILEWLTAPRKPPFGRKPIHLKKTAGMKDLSRLLKEITTLVVKGYQREGALIKGYTRTQSRWTSKQEKFILDNPQLSIQELAKKLGKTYHSVRTKRQRLLGIRKY